MWHKHCLELTMVEKPHKRLDAWKLAMNLVRELYRSTESFPVRENYGLCQQIRRAGVSIPSNIAEGAGRQTRKEFVNYLHMAQGSLSELDTQLELAEQLGYMKKFDSEATDICMQRIDKMLTGLIRQQKSSYPSHLTPHALREKR